MRDNYLEKVKHDLLKDVAVIEEFRRTPEKSQPDSSDSFLADYPWLRGRGRGVSV